MRTQSAQDAERGRRTAKLGTRATTVAVISLPALLTNPCTWRLTPIDHSCLFQMINMRMSDDWTPSFRDPHPDNKTRTGSMARRLGFKSAVTIGSVVTREHPNFRGDAAFLKAELEKTMDQVMNRRKMLASIGEHHGAVKKAAYALSLIVREGQKFGPEDIDQLDNHASNAVLALVEANAASIPLLPGSAIVALVEAAVDSHLPTWTLDKATRLFKSIRIREEDSFSTVAGWAVGAGQNKEKARAATAEHAFRLLESLAWTEDDGSQAERWRRRANNLARLMEEARDARVVQLAPEEQEEPAAALGRQG